MNLKSKRITTLLALLLIFATSQVYVGVSFAGPGPVIPAVSTGIVPQQTTGVLTTQGNKEISVNGANAISGATIVSGASIQTPTAVGATVNLGELGWLEIEPGANLTLEFSPGVIKVMMIQGCATLHTKQGTTGEFDTSQGLAGKTNPAKDDVLHFCDSRKAAAAIPGAAGAGGGLSAGAIIAILGGVGAAVAIGLGLSGGSRGINPSPSSP